ncbi:MAG TPA: helix-turn-helix domain-containing protein [Solirubrobacteraceae bacterium]
MSRYRGQSADERQAARRRQLLDAGFELLGEEGWSATTVRGVCARAKLTPRFFYESFPDIDALAVAVFDEIVERATVRFFAALQDAPAEPQARVRAGLEALIGELTDDPRRARIAFVEALGSEALTRRRLEILDVFAQVASAEGRAAYRPPAEADAFVDLAAKMVAGGMAELLIEWTAGRLPHTREQLVEDCVDMFGAIAEAAAKVARRRVP